MVNLGGIDKAEPLSELEPFPDQRLSHLIYMGIKAFENQTIFETPQRSSTTTWSTLVGLTKLNLSVNLSLSQINKYMWAYKPYENLISEEEKL